MKSVAGNLPVELSSFVGRGRELSEVRRLLSSAHVITLTGPGGIGKSRLALRAAHRLERTFRTACGWSSWPSWTARICSRMRWLGSLGVYEGRGDDIDEALAATYASGGCCWCSITASTCWTRAGGWSRQWCLRCERVRVLCTSRERLDVPGEAVVALSALDVPVDGERLSAAALADVEALRLLVDRAVAVAPGFVSHGRELRGGERDLPPFGRAAAGDRAGRGAAGVDDRRRSPRPAGRSAAAAGGHSPGRAGAQPDAARDGRLELRAAVRGGAGLVAAAERVRGQLRPRRPRRTFARALGWSAGGSSISSRAWWPSRF